MDLTYPPSPWNLHGDAVVSIFLVPRGRFDRSPPGTRPITVAGRAVIAAAFVTYREPSALRYEEVLTAVLVRRRGRRRPGVWIDRIWVDSPASRDGGRELWAIPKELAALRRDASSADAEGIASLRWRRSRLRPLPLPIAFSVMQERIGRTVVTPVSGRILATPGRATWRFGDSLSHLRGRRSVMTLVIRGFRLRFGR